MIENAIRKFPAVGWMRNSLTDTGFHEVHSFKISSMEEARDTANVVAQRKVVLINYEGIDRELGQRAVDFIFGNCYASNASCIKIRKPSIMIIFIIVIITLMCLPLFY